MRQRVNDAEAIALHRDKKWTVARIANHFQVLPPAIYRSFKRGGYVFQSIYHLRPLKKSAPPKLRLPKEANPNPPAPMKRKSYLTGAALFESAPPPIEPRDPCPRCGVRGDI